MGLYRDEGIVLRTYKLGEADRIVVLLTREHGKVRAVAKGVRKTKSRFGGRLEPLGSVSLLLYRGRELDIITQAEALDSFPLLRADLPRMTDAMALLEAVDHVAQEREPNPELYRMLRGALRTIAQGPERPGGGAARSGVAACRTGRRPVWPRPGRATRRHARRPGGL
ncbi:MAG: DNA repair protein RecO [Acidimicrobiaceae bacterium]|nr:DNA repair protein RecO [Acidimicrobiaceae bacterium]